MLRFVFILLIGVSLSGQEPPDTLIINSLENIFQPVVFLHGRHAQMEGMDTGCARCHHFSSRQEYPPCETCHSADLDAETLSKPSLNTAYHRNCLSCHREWSHTEVCETCHVRKLLKRWKNPAKTLTSGDFMRGTHPVIEVPEKLIFEVPDLAGSVEFHHREHVQLYQLDCVSCHREENCSKCHEYEATGSPPHVHLREEHDPCQSCHDIQDGDCEFCHEAEPNTGFSHDLTGWILRGPHADLGCNACHPRGKPVAVLEQHCPACHPTFPYASFDHAMTGLRLDETHLELDCEDCHTTEPPGPSLDCSTCHDDEVAYPGSSPGQPVE